MLGLECHKHRSMRGHVNTERRFIGLVGRLNAVQLLDMIPFADSDGVGAAEKNGWAPCLFRNAKCVNRFAGSLIDQLDNRQGIAVDL